VHFLKYYKVIYLIKIFLQVVDFNELDMWYLTVITLIAILVVIMILRLEGRRKRELANKIPGPDGSIFIGMLPIFLQGPEKLILNGLKVYQK